MIEKTHLDNIREIRHLMERSSRFLSLSGLSGIIIGLYALATAFISAWYVRQHGYDVESYHLLAFLPNGDTNNAFLNFHIYLAVALLLLSFLTAWVFTRQAASRQGLPSWDATAKRMTINLLIPLFAGGLFILALLQRLEISLVIPAMLLFYGLALLNASKYTFNDIRFLGLLQILAGLLAAFLPSYGLWLWAAGFGLLHILYGIMMYYKYRQ